jgi:FG-GAP-like repeat
MHARQILQPKRRALETNPIMMPLMRSLLLCLVTTCAVHGTMHLRCVADMDRDGTPDLIMQDDSSGKAEVWYLSYASAQVTRVDQIAASNPWRIVAAADFNGDGYPDLVWQDYFGAGGSQIWYMGANAQVLGSAVLTTNAWRIQAVGDFDGDGMPDLVWQDVNNSGAVQIWFMHWASSTTTAPTLLSARGVTTGNPWRTVTSADFNLDGKSDLVWQDINGGGGVQIWYMNAALVTGAANVTGGTSLRIHGTGDLNRDTHPDLFLDDSSGTVTVWYMGGAPGNTILSSAPISVPGAPPSVILSAPVNGSGNQSTSPMLSWAQSAGATSYDVYLGTSRSPAFAGNVGVTSYATAGLSAATTYYWTVVAKNSTGSAGAPAAWTFTTGSTAPPITLPIPLKGVNYFPRGHAWWSMLYDWYTQDCATSTVPASCSSGQTVGTIVSNDLQMLHQNGFNFIHLYLWDQDIAQAALHGSTAPLVSSGFQAPGFAGWDDGGPQSSPANSLGPHDGSHNQWTALAEFVSAAKNNGIELFLEFAVSRPGKEISPPNSFSPAAVGANYAGWVNAFFDHVAIYQDVLIWGITYGTGQGVTGPFWQAAYPAISTHFQQNLYSIPAGRALLAVDANFTGPSGSEVQPVLSGYQWNWQTTQSEAYQWQQYAAPPDLYSFQLWNANAGDLQAALECVAGQANSFCSTPAQTCGAQCAPIPFSKMVTTEFGTGSSLESSPIGNAIASYGDANTATTTAAGQRDWLTQTLCVMNRFNILNTGYFGLYDSASWWEQDFNHTGVQLAWDGYWGLLSEVSSFNSFGANGIKPAWGAMNGFNPGACPASNIPATPVIAMQADAAYYTVNDIARLTYSAANVTSLSLNEPPTQNPPSFACDSSQTLPGNSLTGSCAFTNVLAANTGTITLTGTNTDVDGSLSTGSSSTTSTTAVTVGLAPIVVGLVNFTTGQACNLTTNPGCTISANQTDIIEVFGLGFSPSGGNMVQMTNQSTQAWLSQADGVYFWDYSRTQINAQIGCFVAPGTWNLYVVSPNAGSVPSAGLSITVNPSISCN